ncbi:MAG TPA: hypothetical protein VIZ43_17030, partial [Trebonia sp.]
MITIPPGLQWMADLVAGQNWPQSDEGRLRWAGQAWSQAGRDLKDLGDAITAAASRVRLGYSGQSSDALDSY